MNVKIELIDFMMQQFLFSVIYTQHALRPYIDSETNHIRHFIKVQFVNNGIEFINFKDKSGSSSIPTYLKNKE